MMWFAFILVTSLGVADGQDASFKIANVRSTHGVLGPARTEESLLPGDTLSLCFDIDGITMDGSGKVRYTIATEVISSRGKVFEQAPREMTASVAFGGNRIPAFTELRLGTEQEAGNYTIKVDITDLATKRSDSIKKAFKVLPKDFGLVRLALTSDQDGFLPVPAIGPGQPLWIHFGVVGFGRDKESGQPNVDLAVQILDEDGKPTLTEGLKNTVSKGVPGTLPGLPIHFLLSPNRSGKFTVAIAAKDKITGKTAKLIFPLTIVSVR